MQTVSPNPKYCGFCPDVAQGSDFLCFCLLRWWKFALYAVTEHVALYFAISGADFLYFWEIWHVHTKIFFLLESCRYHQTITSLGFSLTSTAIAAYTLVCQGPLLLSMVNTFLFISLGKNESKQKYQSTNQS